MGSLRQKRVGYIHHRHSEGHDLVKVDLHSCKSVGKSVKVHIS